MQPVYISTKIILVWLDTEIGRYESYHRYGGVVFSHLYILYVCILYLNSLFQICHSV